MKQGEGAVGGRGGRGGPRGAGGAPSQGGGEVLPDLLPLGRPQVVARGVLQVGLHLRRG